MCSRPSGDTASPEQAERGVLPPFEGVLSIDADGRWRHDGVEITHERTIRLLFRALEPDGAGGYRVRLGRESAPVVCEDAPLFVRSIEESRAGLVLILSDGTRETLDPSTISAPDARGLRCRVRGGQFPARFSRPAYYMLADFIEENPPGRYALRVAGRVHPIPPSPRSAAADGSAKEMEG